MPHHAIKARFPHINADDVRLAFCDSDFYPRQIAQPSCPSLPHSRITPPAIPEALDTDAYGNTIVYSESEADDTWFNNDDPLFGRHTWPTNDAL
jgi:hypothetical protein